MKSDMLGTNVCSSNHLQCLDFPNFGSWSNGFVRSIELRDQHHKQIISTASEAQEGDLISFRGSWGTMEAVIVDNSQRMFSFQSLDETLTVYWEFVPLPHNGDSGEPPKRTFFKHWEYQQSKPTHFWERHGPFKTANEEELDKFNDALKKECERRVGAIQL
jgi:hypothetical protein